jgi:parvulin-like peptidyl-prolyl isomerase
MSRRWAPLHFVLLGAALFAIHALWIAPAREQQTVFVIDAGALSTRAGGSNLPLQSAVDDEILYREAVRRGLDRGDAVIFQRLVRDMRFLDPDTKRGDEELYGEALELGLDKSDVVVRRRLVERMRRRLLVEAAIPLPTDEELEAHLRENAQNFDPAPRVRLKQLFFEDPETAAATGARLRDGSIDEGEVRGDPLPIPARLPSLSEREVSARFGSDFAVEVFALEPEAWHGPLRSAYGFHLVRIEDQTPGRPARLDEVRARVLGDWRAEREAIALERALAALRFEYTIVRSANVDPGEDSGGKP